jgi:putative phosphoesterase
VGVRIAALYDIHGNLPALDAVLAETERERVDLIVGVGDFVMGPMPRETLERLATLGDRARFIRGNAEREVLQRSRGALPAEDQDIRAGRPPEVAAQLATRTTPEGRVRPALEGVSARTVVCGHTHVQYSRRVGTIGLVNAGAVGMPYEGVPGAFWALLGPGVTLRRTAYDFEEAAQQISASAFPHARQFAERSILHPFDPDYATNTFERMVLEYASGGRPPA